MRVKRGLAAHRRHKKYLDMAKGFRGGRSRLYRIAREAVERSLAYAFHGRKLRKRDLRRLWILRINAGARLNGLSYSRFIHGRSRPAWSSTARCWPISPYARRPTSRLWWNWRNPDWPSFFGVSRQAAAPHGTAAFFIVPVFRARHGNFPACLRRKSEGGTACLRRDRLSSHGGVPAFAFPLRVHTAIFRFLLPLRKV